MRKICVVTGSRSEYGLLSHLMKLLQHDSELCLQLIATNMHLSQEFGLTYKEIEGDGFVINKKVEMLLSSDTANATCKSMGLAIIGFADAFEDLKPDIILVLGDRYEIFAAVTAALFFKIPVAHIHGGEITEGAYDDALRHAITKMSHLHFTSTDEHQRRVIQLGEDPKRVFNVGAIGLDNIKHMHLLSKKQLEESLNFKFGRKSVLVTFHPVTLEEKTAEDQINALIKALHTVEDLRILFTMTNSDTDGRIIIKIINQYVAKNKNRSISFASLGQLRYFSALQYVSAVVGNSSSGLIEAPSFGIPSLNIGNRQQGRLKPVSVVNCNPTFEDILDKLHFVLSPKFKSSVTKVNNPYQKEDTSKQILSVLKHFDLSEIVKKRFYDLKHGKL
jgi:UDP-hydrolysing UDP-N-acetyl-D-glucosamine 2-epimerase